MKTSTPVSQPYQLLSKLLAAKFLFTGIIVGTCIGGAWYYGSVFAAGISQPSTRHGAWLVAVLVTVYVCALSLIIFLFHRWQTACLRNQYLERRNQEQLQTLAEVAQIRGCLPVCASCKKIRDSTGEWNCMTDYLHDRLGTRFTHGICPECSYKLYPRYAEQLQQINGTRRAAAEVLQVGGGKMSG